MTRGKRVLVFVGAAAAVVVLGWVLLIGAVYAWGGVLTVRVSDPDEGINLYVPVPMAAVDAALASSHRFGHIPELEELEIDLGEWRPLVNEVLATLDEAPDMTLVEVEDGRDHVRIVKENGKILVLVEDGHTRVKVSFPTRAVKRTVGRLMS